MTDSISWSSTLRVIQGSLQMSRKLHLHIWKALQDYSLFLRGCSNAMEEVHELNMPANLQTIIRTLPYKLRDKWRTVACELHERCSQRATFIDINNFIERQVKILTDPVFGNIQDVWEKCTENKGQLPGCHYNN